MIKNTIFKRQTYTYGMDTIYRIGVFYSFVNSQFLALQNLTLSHGTRNLVEKPTQERM